MLTGTFGTMWARGQVGCVSYTRISELSLPLKASCREEDKLAGFTSELVENLPL